MTQPSRLLAAAVDTINQNLTGLKGIDLTIQRLFDFFTSFSCWFIRFGIIAIAIMMVVYGILFLKSRGSPQGMATGIKALTWGIVGAIVIFAVFTIILSVAKLIGVDYQILKIINC